MSCLLHWCASDSFHRAVENPDLHGTAPDRSTLALLLIDVINDLEFPDGDKLLEFTLPAAQKIAELKRRGKENGVPVIFVNDNFGRWRSDFRRQVRHCLDDGVRGRPVAELLTPEEDDYFVLKPKHSGFFSTSLDLLLDYLGTETLIITGVAGNLCVLYTANDAYMRAFHLVIPVDGVASETEGANRYALEQMRRHLKAQICAAEDVQLTKRDE